MWCGIIRAIIRTTFHSFDLVRLVITKVVQIVEGVSTSTTHTHTSARVHLYEMKRRMAQPAVLGDNRTPKENPGERHVVSPLSTSI